MTYLHMKQNIIFCIIILVGTNFLIQIKSQGRLSSMLRWPLYSVAIDVKFYLYPNPENEDYREQIDIFNTTLFSKSSYNASKPLIILIHGLLASPGAITDVQNIKNTYLGVRQEANIVMVDHATLAEANLPNNIPFIHLIASIPANFNSFRIGRRISDFIRFLIDNKALPGPEAVHIIGLSSGCYMAGMAGETISKTMSDQAQIGRISGLDCPGGQLFPSLLNSADAKFVDITYTATGMTGMFGRVGHVDYYINGGGVHQPQCKNSLPLTEPYCSHFASVYYFTKSIRNKHISGCRCLDRCTLVSARPKDECKDPIVYGQYVNQSARGDFYVEIPY